MSNIKIKLLIELYNNALETKNYTQDFDYSYGFNGFVLFPKDTALLEYCIKCPMNRFFKNVIIHKEKNKTKKRELKQIIRIPGSIYNDLNMFIELKNHPVLNKSIPNFYYPDDSLAKNSNFIIMERLNGTFVTTKTLTKGHNIFENELIDLAKEFQLNGYDFDDAIQGIYDVNKKRIILIDLGSLYKMQ
jgi:hypothetical protein